MISDNGVSRVWRDGNWIFKQQPKFMTDNEIWCLETMLRYDRYVPSAEQVEIELIKMEYIEQTLITDFDVLRGHFEQILYTLGFAGIRHGDLTRPNILIRNNHPYLIDFSESRLTYDPRVDKRPEGDKYWLWRTFDEITSNLQ